MSSSAHGSALLGYDEAAALIASRAAQVLLAAPRRERVSLAHALGRVLAQSIFAEDDQPVFARSARDGFACRAHEAATHQPLPIMGSTRAGQPPAGPLPPNSVWEIMTGAAVPSGADAVVMIEHVEVTGQPSAQTMRLLPPRSVIEGENVIARAAHARKGDELLSPGCTFGASQIALAATCGHASIEVFVRPRVAILATGDEIIPIEATPAPGQIRNSNAPMLAALVSAAGGEPWVLPAAADIAEALDTALAQAAEADMLVITGGVSAGKFDLVEPALERAGATFHFTGVRIQPGKPTVFGELPRPSTNAGQAGCCILCGLPGNPVSSSVTFTLFAAPILTALAGKGEIFPRFALAELAAPVKTKPGLTRFLPAECDFSFAMPRVELVQWHGSGDIAAMARGNCYLVVPDNAPQLAAGAIVRILLP